MTQLNEEIGALVARLKGPSEEMKERRAGSEQREVERFEIQMVSEGHRGGMKSVMTTNNNRESFQSQPARLDLGHDFND